VKRVVSPTRSSEDYVTGHIIMADGSYRTV
jgi:hypothetical protein